MPDALQIGEMLDRYFQSTIGTNMTSDQLQYVASKLLPAGALAVSPASALTQCSRLCWRVGGSAEHHGFMAVLQQERSSGPRLYAVAVVPRRCRSGCQGKSAVRRMRRLMHRAAFSCCLA